MFEHHSRVLPRFVLFFFENTAYVLFHTEKMRNLLTDIPLDKKSPLGLPRFDQVRFGVHWRFGLGVRRKGSGAFTGNHPCGAKPAFVLGLVSSIARRYRFRAALPPFSLPPRSPSEESWSDTSRRHSEGDKGWPTAGPDRRFLNCQFFLLWVWRAIPDDTGRSGAHPDSPFLCRLQAEETECASVVGGCHRA